MSEFSQAKEDADQVSGLDVAFTNEQVGTSGIIDLSNEPMCMQTFAENMATQGKVSLVSSRYPNTEMVVDPSGLPQGPSGGSPLEASNGFLPLFEADNYCIYVTENGDLRFNSDNLTINVEDDGFLKSSDAISTGTSAFELYNKYPQSYYTEEIYTDKEETTINMYLVKSSFFTEIGTNAPLSKMYEFESDDTVSDEHYASVQMETHDSSSLSYLWNLKKMVSDDGVDFKLTSRFESFEDFNTWVNDSALYLIGYVYNNSDVNPGYGGVGNPYHDVGLFTFGGADPVMYCNDGETASYAEGEYPTQTPLAVNLPNQMWITETGSYNLGFTGIYVRASVDYNFTYEGNVTMPYYQQENGAFAMRYNDANARWEFGDDLSEVTGTDFMGSYGIYGETLDSMSDDMDVSLTEPSDWNTGGGNSGGGNSGGGNSDGGDSGGETQGPTGDSFDTSWVGEIEVTCLTGEMAYDCNDKKYDGTNNRPNLIGTYEFDSMVVTDPESNNESFMYKFTLNGENAIIRLDKYNDNGNHDFRNKDMSKWTMYFYENDTEFKKDVNRDTPQNHIQIIFPTGHNMQVGNNNPNYGTSGGLFEYTYRDAS